jgi:hypothetical protein
MLIRFFYTNYVYLGLYEYLYIAFGLISAFSYSKEQ